MRVRASYLNRGICNNNLYISKEELEAVLLKNLQVDLLRPAAVALAIEEFGKQLRANLETVSGEIAQMRTRKEKLEGEIRNLTKAIADGAYSKSIVDEIALREWEIGAITDRLLSSSAESIEGRIAEIWNYIQQRIQNLSDLLSSESPIAKQELHRHLRTVTMHPVEKERGWFYVAEGSWNLLGTDENAPREEQEALNSSEGRLRLVAGAGFEPATFGL